MCQCIDGGSFRRRLKEKPTTVKRNGGTRKAAGHLGARQCEKNLKDAETKWTDDDVLKITLEKTQPCNTEGEDVWAIWQVNVEVKGRLLVFLF